MSSRVICRECGDRDAVGSRGLCRRCLKALERAEVGRMKEEGYSVPRIAFLTGKSERTILRMLHEIGKQGAA